MNDAVTTELHSAAKLAELLRIDARTLRKRIRDGGVMPKGNKCKVKLYALEDVREMAEQMGNNATSEKYRLVCRKLTQTIAQLQFRNKREQGLFVELDSV